MAAFAGSFAKTNSPRKMKRTKSLPPSLPRSAEQTARSKVKRTKSELRRAVSFAPVFLAFLTAHSSLFSRGSFHGGGGGGERRRRRGGL